MRALTNEDLPGQCEVCRQWRHGRLCGDCKARFAAPAARCERCALRLVSTAVLCGECLRQPPPQVRTLCVADYGFPWDQLIADFKFRGRVDLAPALAALLLQATADDAAPDLVLPVPLAPRRLAERGYNQAWELARRIARARRLPASAGLLARPVETAHQADLPRAARLANLRAAFVVDHRRRGALQGRRVALVDDVLTTGATVREAAATLLRAGAAAVHVWVLARTPDA
jgi:ComF family protein